MMAETRKQAEQMTYGFEALVNGRMTYIGKVETTLDEIKAALPYAEVVGNLVSIYSVAR